MYLISIYFDEKSDKTLRKWMKQVADATKNTFMIDGNVPPHITVGAFDTKNEEEAISRLTSVLKTWKQGSVELVSVGTFQNSSVFLSAVYSEYLHELCTDVCRELENVDNTIVRANYRPFHWLPHVTLGKTMTKEQQQEAMKVLQTSFAIMKSKIVSVGVAKTNPYKDIITIELE